MNQQPLVSVIVPVYMVEEYLDRCVESLVSQTYNNLEIILVDDGSPDSCSGLCDGWIEKDGRIKVIHKLNGGLSDARNFGMDTAGGEYIFFLDSDDWLYMRAVEIAVDAAFRFSAQIVAFNYVVVDSPGYNPSLTDKYEVLNSEQAIENTMDNINVRTVVWNKLYQKRILKDLRFQKGKLHEDEFFTFYALDKADTIVYLYRELYFYFKRQSSIMNTAHIECTDALEGMCERALFVKSKYPELFTKAKVILSASCVNQYSALLKCNKDCINSRNKVKVIRKKIRISLNDVKTLNIKFALLHILSNYSFGLRLFAVLKKFIKR